jgi:hypothetical protein
MNRLEGVNLSLLYNRAQHGGVLTQLSTERGLGEFKVPGGETRPRWMQETHDRGRSTWLNPLSLS